MIHKSNLNSSLKKFDQSYLNLRKKEDRIFNIEDIKQLPDVPITHIHYSEWMKRKHTFEMFISYLKNKEVNSICDLACGNGWFLNKLAFMFRTAVGIEVNELELNQAAKVLAKHDNIKLYLGDVFDLQLDEKFDIITVNAAIQYFNPLNKIINKLLDLLTDNGELHIVDSPFYRDEKESLKAKERSEDYYKKNGAEELNNFYHHHNLSQLKKFNYKIMYDPYTFSNKIKRKISPQSHFHWIKIQK